VDSSRTRVFLLDDHEIVRQGLRNLIERTDDLEVVGEAGTAAETIRRVPACRPQVAVLDGRLPDGSGIDVCRDLRAADPDLKVIILTSFDDDDALFSAIMAGASGYLLKQMRGNDVLEAIRRVAGGQSLLDPAVTTRVLTRLRDGDPKEDPRLAALSSQERKILALIADGMTNRQIAEQLYLAEKTIKNYVSSILSKLGMERRTQAAVYAATMHDHPFGGQHPHEHG
jgi:DNA-binding NarL/FixJ family response regulator